MHETPPSQADIEAHKRLYEEVLVRNVARTAEILGVDPVAVFIAAQSRRQQREDAGHLGGKPVLD